MAKVVFECEDYLVVQKMSGESVHNESGDGLIISLREQLNCRSLYPVHRLDKDTSGLMLLAKTEQSNRLLSKLFQQRRVEKYYLAISKKKPMKKQGLIAGDMVRSRNGCWKLSKAMNNPAVTQFFSFGVGDGRRLFILKPHTGKTHQLRVALQSLGSAIAGDSRYGKNNSSQSLCLHAYVLSFPYLGRLNSYSCTPPIKTFDSQIQSLIINKLQQPAKLPWPIVPKSVLDE